MVPTPENPTNSGALCLLELRRQLLRRAGSLTARARGLRQKGESSIAARMTDESQRLLDVARTMGEPGAIEQSLALSTDIAPLARRSGASVAKNNTVMRKRNNGFQQRRNRSS